MQGAGRAVVLMNPFEVPPDVDDAFVGEWERARDCLPAHEGFGAT